MARCSGFFLENQNVEDDVMYRFGTDVDDQDKYVGCEWKTPTFLRHAPTRYIYHTVKEVSCQDTINFFSC